MRPVFERAEKIEEEIKIKKERIDNLSYLTKLDSDLEGLLNLSEIIVDVIIISRDNYKKLKVNYENIPAIVLHINDEKENIVLLTATIDSLREDYLRIFESLNYTKVDIPTGYKGTASQVITQINSEIKELENELTEIRNSIHEFNVNYRNLIRQAISVLEIEKESEKVREHAAVGRSLFCLVRFHAEIGNSGFQRIHI